MGPAAVSTADWKGTLPAGVGLVLGALIAHFLGNAPAQLWYDELQSTTFAALSLPDLLRAVHIYDPHPPLYYVQLHGWLLGGSDVAWIRLNSTFWHVLGVLSLFGAGRALYGRTVGLTAAILLALSPYAAFYGHEVRMYSMVMCLAVWLFFLTHRFLYGGPRLVAGVGLFIVELTVLYSHGAGFMVVVGTAVLAIFYLWRGPGSGPERIRHVRLWLVGQGVVALAYAPWLIQAQTVNVGHLVVPDATIVVRMLSVLALGFGTVPGWLRVGAALGVIVLPLLLWLRGREWSVFISFVTAPIVVTALITFLYRPLWHHRTLAFIVPFLCLGVALALAPAAGKRVGQGRRLAPTLLLLGLLLYALLAQRVSFARAWDMQGAAAHVQTAVQPSDTIYVPHSRVFWNFGWYYGGPGSINPLRMNEPILVDGIPFFSDAARAEVVVDGRCYWLVYRAGDNSEPLEKGVGEVVAFAEINVERQCPR